VFESNATDEGALLEEGALEEGVLDEGVLDEGAGVLEEGVLDDAPPHAARSKTAAGNRINFLFMIIKILLIYYNSYYKSAYIIL
jgi:hypothetical protein